MNRIEEFLTQFPLDNDIRQIDKKLKDKKPCRTLIIGCLEEPLANHLAEQGFDVTGVDLRPYNCGDEYIGPEKPLYNHITGDFLDAKIDGLFDMIISISVIEHSGLGYYKDKIDEHADIRIMQKAAELLAPGGKMMITVPIGGVSYQTKHWRLYTPNTLKLLTAPFNVELLEYWQTSYLGREQVDIDAVMKNVSTADISALLILTKKESLGRKVER